MFASMALGPAPPALISVRQWLSVLRSGGSKKTRFAPMDRASAQILFQVISDSYERRSVIITTNLEFSRWVGIFYDEQMTAAMIDRLVHHSYLLLFDGQSNRVRDSLMKSAG